MNWFDVDKEGLRKLLDARGKSAAILELAQNAFDAEGTTRVDLVLHPIANQATALLTVTDDSPLGFENLAHAWTLFAESSRKANPEKRGRFNLGEKLILSLCREATITTTTGAVRFDAQGRHRLREKTKQGSRFSALISMTRDELRAACDLLRLIIPPTQIAVTLNDVPIKRDYADLIAAPSATLPTEISDGTGILRRSLRKTLVAVWRVREGEEAHIFEMGIPVVATGEKFHYNVHQKIPLNMNRDNVTSAYLQQLRAVVLSATFGELRDDDSRAPWVRNAMEDPDVSQDAVRAVVKLQFGDRAVINDPSDTEGTKIAVTQGFTVVPGGAYSADAWRNVRSAAALLPAGKVTPSPKPFKPGGKPLKMVDVETPVMLRARSHAKRVAERIIGKEIAVHFANDRNWPFVACYGDSELIVNVPRVPTLREDTLDEDALNELLLHELAHDRVSDHLSNSFHEECCRLGALLAKMYREAGP